MTRFFAIIIAFLQLVIGLIMGKNTMIIDSATEYQTFESFGTSSCWWAQTINDEEQAKEIARLLYSKDGLNLDVFRYNIGAGEKDNPTSRIKNPARKTESFYVFNDETGEYEYDFTRDKNARRVLDFAVEYGADKIILFCNSPHFSMTKSGHASGGLEEYSSNLPKENYMAFVDYVLTIADWFVSKGYPVYAISPINEPMWSWGGDNVTQEGCHYSADETVELLELFAKEMTKRNSPYKLHGVENGKMDSEHYEYIEKFFESDILSSLCDSYCGHSYWMDSNPTEKKSIGDKFKKNYPDKKYEMTEWCELPLEIDSNTIESGIKMANAVIDDFNVMNAVSWQSWTAVNEDGVLDKDENGNLIFYKRYYAFKQFTSFIEPEMKRVKIIDSLNDDDVKTVAFTNGEKTVIIAVNSTSDSKELQLKCVSGDAKIYVTDETHNCEKVYEGSSEGMFELPKKSIVTFSIT